jgi:protein-L-isoaspartate(D-aspartate) O-methyltransferase
VEIIGGLLDQARERLGAQGINNVETRLGNGRLGWPEFAPFDKIILAASAELMPPELLNQLKPGGRMVLPTGIEGAQQLMLVDKDMDGRISTREVLGVRFALLEEC